MLRKRRMTALQKSGGGVRGIVVGDAVRRLVGQDHAQKFSKAVEGATAPFQYAFSTKAGCEYVAHALQSLSEPRSNHLVHRRDQCVRPPFQEGHVDRTGRS